MSLNYAEQERTAYLAGNGLLASLAAEADDREFELDCFDDQLEAARIKGYEDGKEEGLGRNAAAELHDQLAVIQRLKTEHTALRNYLNDLAKCLEGDACKTVAGRKQVAKAIWSKFIATPRY